MKVRIDVKLAACNWSRRGSSLKRQAKPSIAWLHQGPESTLSLIQTNAVEMALALLVIGVGSVVEPEWVRTVGRILVGVSLAPLLRVLWRLAEKTVIVHREGFREQALPRGSPPAARQRTCASGLECRLEPALRYRAYGLAWPRRVGDDTIGVERPSRRLYVWVADHRDLVRCQLTLIDLATAVFVVLAVLDRGADLSVYMQPVVWGVITLHWGWLMPREVDRWRIRQLSN